MKEKHQEDLKEAVRLFNQLNLESENLDRLVHSCKDREAKVINDLGPTDQLEYLLGVLGKEDLINYLETINAVNNCKCILCK